MNVDEVIVKNEPVCEDYLVTTEIKTKKIKQEVKQEPMDNESQTSSSQNESTSKEVVVKTEEEEETIQTISIAFLNETTTQNETTTNEKSK